MGDEIGEGPQIGDRIANGRDVRADHRDGGTKRGDSLDIREP
jgi:hypothetical protein